jgi:hypothetical protein
MVTSYLFKDKNICNTIYIVISNPQLYISTSWKIPESLLLDIYMQEFIVCIRMENVCCPM